MQIKPFNTLLFYILTVSFSTLSCRSIHQLPNDLKVRVPCKLAQHSKMFKFDIDEEVLDLMETILDDLYDLGPEITAKFESELTAAILSKNMNNIRNSTETIYAYYEALSKFKARQKYEELLEERIPMLSNVVFLKAQLFAEDVCWQSNLVSWREQMHSEEKYYGGNRTLFGILTLGATVIQPFFGLGVGLTGMLMNQFQKKNTKRFVDLRKERNRLMKIERKKLVCRIKQQKEALEEKRKQSKKQEDL